MIQDEYHILQVSINSFHSMVRYSFVEFFRHSVSQMGMRNVRGQVLSLSTLQVVGFVYNPDSHLLQIQCHRLTPMILYTTRILSKYVE